MLQKEFMRSHNSYGANEGAHKKVRIVGMQPNFSVPLGTKTGFLSDQDEGSNL
jgi:hypothetical protein